MVNFMFGNPDFIVQIRLPTGAYVKVGTTYIEYHASVQDIDKVHGLCGTFTFDCTDDFELPDGSQYNDPEATKPCDRDQPGQTCAVNTFEPDDYCHSWR